jgi:magnesium and cobalt transporter
MGKLFGGKESFSVEKIIDSAAREGEIPVEDAAMVLNVLRFGKRQVRDVMIPRTDIVCAEVGDALITVSDLIIESGHSRIPIYKNNRDNIVGIVHAKDLLNSCIHGDAKSTIAGDLMREPFFLPETKNLKAVLQDFLSQKTHMAVALDEYGGTSGLVTFEDVLEEIVGEIEDEYDEAKPEEIHVQDDGSMLVAGRTTLEDLERRIQLELDSEQVDTLSGWLCEKEGRVPEEGECYHIRTNRITVKEADAKQVHWVVLETDVVPEIEPEAETEAEVENGFAEDTKP